MSRRLIAVLALIVLALPARGRAATCSLEPALSDVLAPVPAVPVAAPEIASAFALPAVEVDAFASPARFLGRGGKDRAPRTPRAPVENMPLGAERARLLLRSLAMPGWGQATIGRRHAAAVFAVAEAGVWGAFTSFRVQEQMRRQSYERTARMFAGINLRGRDDEYRRIVGAFASSEEYNLFVVTRDAANLYLGDLSNPDLAAYRAYVAEHSIGGSDAWRWTDEASFLRYRAQRKDTQRAALRANVVLGFAMANRLISALHVTRAARKLHPGATEPSSWRFDVTPGEPGDAVAFRAGLRTSF